MKKAEGSEFYTDAHNKAFLEVIDIVNDFLLKNKSTEGWTLKELFFHTYPEYEIQWGLMDEAERERVKILSPTSSIDKVRMSDADKARLVGWIPPARAAKELIDQAKRIVKSKK